MAFDVAHYDGMLGAWGGRANGVGGGGGLRCDMAGPHQSKGRGGQTFSRP